MRSQFVYAVPAALAVCLVGVGNAQAQTAGDQGSASTTPAATDGPQPAPESESGLQDIVVTAKRRSENLPRAPIAIDAASGEAVPRAGITGAVALQAVLPSLSVSNQGAANVAFFARGVGTFSTNAYSDPANI